MVCMKENTYKLASDCLCGNDDRSRMVRKLTEMSCWTIVGLLLNTSVVLSH